MAKAGDFIKNPGARIAIKFTKTAKQTDCKLLQLDMFVEQDGHVVYEHIHPYADESFEVISGSLRLCIDGNLQDLTEGMMPVVVKKGLSHKWCNIGDKQVHVRLEFRPALRMEEFLVKLFALACNNKTDEQGRPEHIEEEHLFKEYKQEIKRPK